MGLKLFLLCSIFFCGTFLATEARGLQCGSLVKDQTDFHRSGVTFKTPTHWICKSNNFWGVSDNFEEIFALPRDIQATEVGAIVFSNSSFMKIPTEIFAKFRSLYTFSAADVGLRIITRDDFTDAHALTSLILRGNLISELEDGIFANLKNLRVIDLSGNDIHVIREETFVGCSEDLYKVDLSGNKIFELDFTTLAPLAHPSKISVELNLAGNAIKFVKESHQVSHLVFESLNLKDNFLRSFSCPGIAMAELHLENNLLETISFDNCSVEYLATSKNKIRWLHVHADMKGLIASKNQIESFVVSGNPQMYHLDLSSNGNIEHVFPTLRHMAEMQYLNLSDSTIGVLHEDTFARMSELKYLFLQNCGIQVIPFGIFANNKHLVTLDLSDNDLETVDLHMFTGLDNLRTLNLSGNKLSYIEGLEKIKTVLPHLKEIGISRNSWKCINLSTMIRTLNVQGIFMTEDKSGGSSESSISGIQCY